MHPRFNRPRAYTIQHIGLTYNSTNQIKNTYWRWGICTNNLTAYEKLYKSADCTADYRFNAYRRLSFLEGASNLSLISASTALIVVSFIVALYSDTFEKERIITIGQNCMPIVMLALSIMVSSAKYGSRAERMHDCAQALNHFKKIIKFKILQEGFSPNADEFRKDAAKYARIISKYENHANLDMHVEKLKSWADDAPLAAILAVPFSIIEKGWVFYFYTLVSLVSLAWLLLALYLAIKGV